MNKLEEELASEWQSKCDKLLAAANDKHERQLAMVREDLKEAQDKASTLEAKVIVNKAEYGDIKIQLQCTSTMHTKFVDIRVPYQRNQQTKRRKERGRVASN